MCALGQDGTDLFVKRCPVVVYAVIMRAENFVKIMKQKKQKKK